ncbi:hypothetical protein ANTQUA_LOCUS791, partial [Anthophora quadrimaculata]
MSAKNSIGDRAPNFRHEDNRVWPSRMRWRTKNDKFSGSRRIGRYVDALGVYRILADVHPVHALSLCSLFFSFLCARLRVNREFCRVSTVASVQTRHRSSYCSWHVHMLVSTYVADLFSFFINMCIFEHLCKIYFKDMFHMYEQIALHLQSNVENTFLKRTTRERLAFPYYLSLAALLTSFLRRLLNKAIPSVDDLWPRRRSCRDIGFVFTVTQWYARAYTMAYAFRACAPFVRTTINSCPWFVTRFAGCAREDDDTVTRSRSMIILRVTRRKYKTTVHILRSMIYNVAPKVLRFPLINLSCSMLRYISSTRATSLITSHNSAVNEEDMLKKHARKYK